MGEAARLGDPIEHTSALAGFITGAVIGIALIAAVAFATFTCGFGVALLAGLAAGIGASAILGLGEAIGKMFSSKTGAINTGSPNVFINGKPAAFATASAVSCSKHNPTPMVAEGSSNVFINSKPAARKGDKVTCGASIAEGSPNVVIGGGTVQYLPVQDEVPSWLRTTVDWAFALAGLVGGLAGLARATGGLSRAMLPCAAKFIGGYVLGEVAGRYVIGPTVSRVFGGLFGHPVDMTTGRKLLLAEQETDYVVQSPIPVALRRFYASNVTEEGTLGPGWVLPWEVRLQRRGGQIWYRDAQGRESGFPEVKPGQASFGPTEQRYLSCTTDGRYVLHDQSETYYEFERLGAEEGAAARLCRIEDQAGQWQSYERDKQGRVAIVRTSGGQELKFAYANLKGRLTCITGGEGTRGAPLVQYGYDPHGRLMSVRDANGNVTRQFSYGEHGLMVSHTNALGFECRYEWADVDGQLRVVASSTSEGEQSSYGYDTQARKSWVHDELGRTAVWYYDEHQQVVHCTDLDGRCYEAEYNEQGQPVVLSLPGGRSVKLDYDEAGRIVAETDPLGRTAKTRYHGNGLRVAEVLRPDGSRWQADYDLQGRLLKTTDPLGRVERYEYLDGLYPWPVAHVDAKGGRKTMEWARRGVLLSYTDCSNKTTRYEYDAEGRLCATVNALDQRVEYTRRPTGEVTQVTLPDGTQELLQYDEASQVILHRSASGQTREWARNARGQVLQATDPAERSLRYRYDAHGRLLELRSDNGARYAFDYDDGDRLKTETRPDGVQRRFAYDNAGRLQELVIFGTSEEPVSKGEAQPKPRRLVRFERDKLGRLLAKANDTSLTSYTWDDGDRLIKAERIPSDEGATLGVQPDTVRFEYDEAGRLRAEHGANGTVAYELDELDNVAALHLPHSQRIDYLSYGSGHVHQIRAGEQVVSDFERDALHREVLRSQGSLLHGTGYDVLGRKLWQSAGLPAQSLGPEQGRFWRSYKYHPAGELAEMKDNLRGAIEFGYDPAGQLLKQVRLDEHSAEQFAWDAAGNLLDDIQRKSKGTIEDNRLKVWQDLRFEYDPWGNLKTKRSGSRQTQRFSFDADDRLVSVVTERGTERMEVRFEYDALGRRMGKVETQFDAPDTSGRSERRRFVWQGLRMVQEVREAGVSNYVYSPDSPYTPVARLDAALSEAIAGAAIAQAKHKARIFHFHTDLVGAPLEVTDEAGELAWAGRYSAWGKVQRCEGDMDVARIEQPLRYPGQYADESTGLHYNTFRYYDPDVGRFISQDPIGLLGGENLYAYAPSTTRWLDPLGLTGAPIVVIGEGQRAVDEATNLLRAQGYEAESMMVPRNQWRGGRLYDGMPSEDFAKAVEWNKQWLKQKIDAGYKVVDIGPDGRPVGSAFYAAEQEAIRESGVAKVTLKKFANGESVAEMRGRVAKGGC